MPLQFSSDVLNRIAVAFPAVDASDVQARLSDWASRGNIVRNPDALLWAWCKSRALSPHPAVTPRTPTLAQALLSDDYGHYRVDLLQRIFSRNMSPRQVAAELEAALERFPQISTSEIRKLYVLQDDWDPFVPPSKDEMLALNDLEAFPQDFPPQPLIPVATRALLDAHGWEDSGPIPFPGDDRYKPTVRVVTPKNQRAYRRAEVPRGTPPAS